MKQLYALGCSLTCLFLWGLSSCAFESSPPPLTQASNPRSEAVLLSPREVPVVANVELVTVVEGLEHPWGLAWLPNGDALITERPGRLRLVKQGQLVPQPVAGLPDIFAQGQGGLLDVAVHPEFAQNRLIYLTYASGDKDKNQTQVLQAVLDDDKLENVQVIFQAKPAKPGTQHFGSRLLWLTDGTLLVAIGDGGNPPLSLDGELIRNQAQKLNSDLGKIHRINADGSIPPDNPFQNNPQAQPSLWSIGHRNIQGLAKDPLSGTIWSTEHGSRGGDELNLIQPGKNYGWPLVTWSEEYGGGEISPLRTKPGLLDPKLVWTPAIAPSGLVIYRGTQVPAWAGLIFAGGLVSQDVRKIEVDQQGQVIHQGRIPIGARVRDVRQGPDQFLYVLTDESRTGRLIRLQPR